MEVGTKPDARIMKKQVKIGAAQQPSDGGIYDHLTNGQLCPMHSRKFQRGTKHIGQVRWLAPDKWILSDVAPTVRNG